MRDRSPRLFLFVKLIDPRILEYEFCRIIRYLIEFMDYRLTTNYFSFANCIIMTAERPAVSVRRRLLPRCTDT